ncbi:MAG: hypothetical protein BWY15_02161 [Firmicutes bacterium ADurb.Bin193]|nr:MAG: hypothetical protein BWY15_02161 [Firmicutes bacterium ADurb.Bin193]
MTKTTDRTDNKRKQDKDTVQLTCTVSGKHRPAVPFGGL